MNENKEPLTMREILQGKTHTRNYANGLYILDQYPHLGFSSIEHYENALEKATTLGGEALKSFNQCFASLERIAINDNGTAQIHPDPSPHSFYFRIYTQEHLMTMDGGIVMHGEGKSFSVELTPKSGIYWRIHT